MGLTFRARPQDQWTDRTVRCLGLPGFRGRPGVLKDLAFSKVQQVVRATTSAFLQLVGEGYDIKWFKGPGLLKSATTCVSATRSAVLQLVEGYGTKRFKRTWPTQKCNNTCLCNSVCLSSAGRRRLWQKALQSIQVLCTSELPTTLISVANVRESTSV